MGTLVAFHNDPAIKAKYLARVRAHRAADELQRGATGERLSGQWRGCAVACTLDRYDHVGYESELGIPRTLAWLEDRIFENLETKEEWDAWPEQFLEAIAPGADLSRVADHFLIWLLGDERTGTIRYCTEQGKEATRGVLALYERRSSGDEPGIEEWQAAAADADAACYVDADASYAAACYASYAAACYDAADAFYACYASYISFAYYDADGTRASRWRAMRDKLLELFVQLQ